MFAIWMLIMWSNPMCYLSYVVSIVMVKGPIQYEDVILPL